MLDWTSFLFDPMWAKVSSAAISSGICVNAIWVTNLFAGIVISL